jgi:hypothetical protein
VRRTRTPRRRAGEERLDADDSRRLQGSVATLIASDLAGAGAPPLALRLFAPLAPSAVAPATVVLRATL